MGRLTLGALSLVALAFCLAPWPAEAAGQGFRTGIFNMEGPAVSDPALMKRAARSGASFLGTNVYWPEIVTDGINGSRPGSLNAPFDPRDPASPYYDFASLDHQVRNAVAVGLRPILRISHSPAWAREGCFDSEVCRPRATDLADFTVAIVRRYSGAFDPGDGSGLLPRVSHWQFWCEPNFSMYYRPVFGKSRRDRSPGTYGALLNVFYKTIHAELPTAKVIGGGLAPTGVPGRAIAPLRFMREIFCLRGRRKLRPRPGCQAQILADIWAVHPYTPGGPRARPGKPDNLTLVGLRGAKRILWAAVRRGTLKGSTPRIPLWITEFSWDTSPPDPGGLDLRTHARWVAEGLYQAHRAGASMVMWFGIRDAERRPETAWQDSFDSGLYLRGLSPGLDFPKPALRAFRFPFFAQRRGAWLRYWGRTPTGKRSPVTLAVRLGQRPPKIRRVRIRANAQGIFRGHLKLPSLTDRAVARVSLPNGETSLSFGVYRTEDRWQPPFG